MTENEGENSPGISHRIKQLFEAKQLNASSAAKELGYSVPSKPYGILPGTTTPVYSTIAPVQTQLQPQPASRLPVVNGGQVATTTVGKDGGDNAELAAQANYAVQHNKAWFVRDLSRLKPGKFRAFEVAGASMEPTQNYNDSVVCSYVNSWRLLVPDAIYAAVTRASVMLKHVQERVANRAHEVMLHSGNSHRQPYPLGAADITKRWRVRGYSSTYLPSAPRVTVERLRKVIEQLSFAKSEVRRYLPEGAAYSALSI